MPSLITPPPFFHFRYIFLFLYHHPSSSEPGYMEGAPQVITLSVCLSIHQWFRSNSSFFMELWDLEFVNIDKIMVLSMSLNKLRLHEKLFVNFIHNTPIRQRKTPFDFQVSLRPSPLSMSSKIFICPSVRHHWGTLSTFQFSSFKCFL